MAHRCLLYYITDRGAFGGDESVRRRELLAKIAEAARAGVNYIQLREKDLTTRELEALARDAVRILTEVRVENPERRTALLINSRTDVALAIGADGVHLRSDDISAREVHGIWEAGHGVGSPEGSVAHNISQQAACIGVSCHSADDVARAAADGATFAVFAPVFEKKDAPGLPPAGLTQLRKACEIKIPVFALGGVTLANARSCLEVGAAGVAGIRLFQENDSSQIVHALTSGH